MSNRETTRKTPSRKKRNLRMDSVSLAFPRIRTKTSMIAVKMKAIWRLTFTKQTRFHCDVRTSVASLPFGQQNTTRRMSFTCRLLDRCRGRWLHTRTPDLCTVALAGKARTDLHYSLPLTVDDVGSAGCTTTCSFARPAFPDLSGT